MTTVRFLGHATFELVTNAGRRILIDPWITGNPSCPIEASEIGDVDVLLITHDHDDHLGQDLDMLVNANTAIPAQPELVAKLEDMGITNGMGMNIGGTVTANDIRITMVQAFHSADAGTPVGFIITTEDGQSIYHAGDTGIFASMETYGALFDLDLALLPIGDHFVMSPEQAAYAAALLKARRVIPMHYKTFPVLVQDASGFRDQIAKRAPNTQVDILAPGERLKI